MAEEEITITVSVPPLLSDDKIRAFADKMGNPYMAAAVRRAMLETRYLYEAERIRLLMQIGELQRQVERASKWLPDDVLNRDED